MRYLLIISLFICLGATRTTETVTLHAYGQGTFVVQVSLNGNTVNVPVYNQWTYQVKMQSGDELIYKGYANRNFINIDINGMGITIPSYNTGTLTHTL